jgi:ribosome maturation factor RimP
MSDASNLKRVHSLVAPLIADLKLDLYDLEFRGGVLRVTIDTPARQRPAVSTSTSHRAGSPG